MGTTSAIRLHSWKWGYGLKKRTKNNMEEDGDKESRQSDK